MLLRLKADLMRAGINQSELGRAVGCSPGTISLIANYDHWPTGRGGKPAMQQRIADYMRQRGLSDEIVASTFNEASAEAPGKALLQMAPLGATSGPQPFDQTKDPFMLLRHHKITAAARQHFRLLRDPFVDELQTDADVFISDDIRYVRAAMRQTAKHGGMLAVVAESGGGKSTLRHDLKEWINSHEESITVVEPYVIGMGDSRRNGRPLMATDITGAVIRAVAPEQSLRQSAQDRADQMHKVLRNSAQVGRRHVLIIEEAHALAVPTIKHMKGFYELQDGFRKLLSVILIGQTELERKLSEHNPEVREVVQRCELVKLPPLDNHVEAYLRHKLKRVDADYDKVFEPGVADAIRDKLRISVSEVRGGQRQARQQSLCHPLAINNLVTRAMNQAPTISAPRVNAALIAAALKGEA